MFHLLDASGADLPQQFTYPFCYTPHPLAVKAAEEVMKHAASLSDWQTELSAGKMLGVLVVRRGASAQIGYLAAYSGNTSARADNHFFVPPVFDFMQPHGYFKQEERIISAISERINTISQSAEYEQAVAQYKQADEEYGRSIAAAKQQAKDNKKRRDALRRQPNCNTEALTRESQHEKAEIKRLERQAKAQLEQLRMHVDAFDMLISKLQNQRKQRSAQLQRWLFDQFSMLNARGERQTLNQIFADTSAHIPPSGAGECCAPKLLQYAYVHGYEPLAMAEFWYGSSPSGELRTHGNYYPSCTTKCEPILRHMLKGLNVEPNPLARSTDMPLEILYDDPYITVINKPHGLLSVPGKESPDSVYARITSLYPDATGPIIVHRLDMATSGVMVVAKQKHVHAALQEQFESHTIKKRYVAILDGVPQQESGEINLPLCPNPDDRPRQMVSYRYGKEAITQYSVASAYGTSARVIFHPLTGRTHQLRMHSAHPHGLGCPIKGDTLYGTSADRLYLHAEAITFVHPATGKEMHIECKAPF